MCDWAQIPFRVALFCSISYDPHFSPLVGGLGGSPISFTRRLDLHSFFSSPSECLILNLSLVLFFLCYQSWSCCPLLVFTVQCWAILSNLNLSASSLWLWDCGTGDDSTRLHIVVYMTVARHLDPHTDTTYTPRDPVSHHLLFVPIIFAPSSMGYHLDSHPLHNRVDNGAHGYDVHP